MSQLRVTGLGASLGGRSVLEGVDLEVEAGELVGLIGPNGAGKTTLIRSILGLIPSSGSVETDGAIGYVPQRHEFAWDFPISVRDAVLQAVTVRRGLLGRARTPHFRAVEEALSLVGMRDLAKRPIGELSGGQRQRVLVARALAIRPAVLLLDEPFTGLDMPTQEMLMDLFRDRLYLLRRTIVASGRPEELADADPWIRAFDVRPDNPILDALGVRA
ncbi:MAG: ATP-binding cassette domain-containing protein [Actinomyces sp.]|nr:ATP-binding cassette domain-containing protein [Actinomyces sp.]